MISLQSFLGRNSPRRRGVWFGFGGSLLKTNEAPHPSGTVKLELALFAWPTSERPAHTPALWWLIAWNPAVQYEQIYVNFTWGAPEFKTYRSKKKSPNLAVYEVPTRFVTNAPVLDDVQSWLGIKTARTLVTTHNTAELTYLVYIPFHWPMSSSR